MPISKSSGHTAHVSRAKIFKQIAQELTVHSQLEETIFYPALKAKTRKNTDESDEVLEAYEEHDNVKAMLRKIDGLDPADDTYNAKLQVLSDLVKHHVKEEEGEMFKQARELLGKFELQGLGEEMAARKEDILTKA